MHRFLAILLLLPLALQAQVEVGPPDPLLITRGVHKVVEESRAKVVITKIFDQQEQLTEQIIRYHNSTTHGKYNYQPIRGGRLVTLQYLKESPRADKHITKFSTDKAGRTLEAEVFLMDTSRQPYLEFEQFRYNDSLMLSFTSTTHGTHYQLYKYSFAYDSLGRLTSKNEKDQLKGGGLITYYFYDQQGRLTGSLVENMNRQAGNPYPVSQEERYKVKYSYEDHDSHGNWQRCYYVTEKGKVFYMKRKITYFRA